ncbi:MAG: hypothetical protein ACFE89_05590 [Candidatus Hodarchaeota archaeon]
MVVGLIGTALVLIVNWIVVSFVIMLAGKLVAGMEATFVKSLLVSLVASIIGTIAYYVIEMFFPMLGWLSGIIVFLLYLAVIKYYFQTGWIGALLVAIIAIIIWVVLAYVMAAFFPGL